MAQIKKLSDGKYLIRVSKGTGKSREFINKTFRGTLKQVRERARELETIVDSGIAIQSRFTFDKFADLWLASIKGKLAPLTYDFYAGNIERHAKAGLGRYAVGDIGPHHVQTLYNSIDKPATVRALHSTLNACFAYAIRKDYIRTSPCKNADLPARPRREINVLSSAEVARFIEVTRNFDGGLILEFALMTGMRPEEYLAVRWSDLRGSDVSINQVVQYNRKGGGYYFAAPKTAKSRRMVSLTDDLQRSLVRHRIAQNEHRLAMKGTWFNHDLIFPNMIGRPHTLANVTNRILKPVLEKCDFGRHIRLYDLRHSCATLLLELGFNPKVVADRLGHASVVMTLDVYSHVLPHIQNDATAALGNLVKLKNRTG